MLFTLTDSNIPVKIADDVAISPEKCYALLLKYIPIGLKGKKVLELLYLK